MVEGVEGKDISVLKFIGDGEPIELEYKPETKEWELKTEIIPITKNQAVPNESISIYTFSGPGNSLIKILWNGKTWGNFK